MFPDKSSEVDPKQSTRTPLARQAAKASWIAPLLACVISATTNSSGEVSRTTHLFIALTGIILMVVGLTFGIIALFGIRKYGRKGILKPAIVGISVNVLFISACLWAFLAFKPMTRLEAERLGSEIFDKYPGWLGQTTLPSATVAAASWDHRSKAARDLNSRFVADISFVSLVVDNRTGKNRLTIDPSSVRLNLTDGIVQHALPTRKVLETAKEHRNAALIKYSGPFQVRPGEKLIDCLAFVPYAFDMSKVVSISVQINGQDTVIEGQYLTAAQKAAYYQQGLEQMQAMVNSSDVAIQAQVVAEKSSDILSEQKITKEALGVETFGGVFAPIIEDGRRVPCSKTEFFSTAEDNQSLIDIALYRGNNKLIKENKFIGCFRVYGIPPAPRGVPKIAITLMVNVEGDIVLKAKDELTGKLLKIRRI